MHLVSLNKDELENAARVKFSDEQIAEFVSLLTMYSARFDDDASAPRFMWPDSTPLNEAFEQSARRAFVGAVRDIWIEAGQGNGGQIGSYNAADGTCSGPLFNLLWLLLNSTPAAGVWSQSTIHHDVVFLATGRERDHGH